MIINSYEQYNVLKSRMNREMHICTPIFRDLYYHVMENKLLCLGITFMNGESFVVSITHEDSTQFDIPVGTATSFTVNSKVLNYYHEDISALAYINSITVPVIDDTFSFYMRDTHNIFGNMRDCNKVIPLTLWSNILHDYNNLLIPIVNTCTDAIDSSQYMFMRKTLHTLQEIEQSGICVNRELLLKHFGSKVNRAFKSNMVYSEYNPYTLTNRPSNRFGGLNYGALNKNDDSRETFISRYESGCLVQMDFEAYHLRLVADDLKVVLPIWKSIHTELAKIYFKTDHITDEMYAESKRKTFEIMYGMNNESYNFELFEKIHSARQQYENVNTITLPTGISTVVQFPTASKLFNYYVQSLEVVKTIPKLQQVLNLIRNTNNHLVLYTYDSILLDMEEYDTTLVKQIAAILEENKKFPIRIYKGTSYNDIAELSAVN